MIQTAAREAQASQYVIHLEVRMFSEYLLGAHAGGQQVQYVNHPNPHAADAWAPPTLVGVHRNAFVDLGHGQSIRKSVSVVQHTALTRAACTPLAW